MKNHTHTFVVLRRKQDRKAIENFLFDNGFGVSDTYVNSPSSRIISIHTFGRYDRKITYDACVRWDATVKQATHEHKGFCREFFGYDDFRVLKSKPSVNAVINELKKYI